MRRRRMAVWPVVVAALATAALATAGCGSMAAAAAPCTPAIATAVTSSIEIAGTSFVPACAKVAPGATITFTNNDGVQHTVTSDAGQPETFDSGLLNQGAQFVHTFASAETEHIHCNVHPSMHLTVIVQ